MPQDLFIRNARIVDGTGAPWFRGCVRVAGGRISEIGAQLTPGRERVIEAADRWLAPGFIDAHCHDDYVFLSEPDRPEKIAQGVTTIVVGNCSFSLYPATAQSREDTRALFSGLLGSIPPDAIFDDFDAYRQSMRDAGIAPNIVSLAGHGPIRLAVLGYENRAATDDEIIRMQALLQQQLDQGAAGISFGLVYPPSAFAERRELVALASTAAAHGKLVAAHVRSYEGGLMASIDEFLSVLGEAKAAGLLSHLQAAGRPNWGSIPAAIARLEAARTEGIDVSFDMYPYQAGSSYILQLLPPAALDGGMAALLERLDDPIRCAHLRRWIEEGDDDPEVQSKISLIGWGNVQISAVGADGLKPLEGLRLDEAAAKIGLSPFDLLLRFIREDEGRTGIVMFQLSEDDVRCACTHRLHMTGSDGLPRPGTKVHPRAFGTFPRMAGPLVASGWFSLEDSVRRMTSVAAQRFGLFDRGVIRPGAVADLVMFTDDLADLATFAEPAQLPTGITDVIVGGVAVIEAGRPTGARPGSVL
jgi:N-acyl-D-amino-acid deacylase